MYEKTSGVNRWANPEHFDGYFDINVNISYNDFFLRNRILLKSSLERKTLCEAVHGKKPKLDHVRIFRGCSYVHDQKKAWCEKFDICATPESIASYCGERAHLILLDESIATVDSLDLKIAESGIIHSNDKNCIAIALDLLRVICSFTYGQCF